MLTSKASAGIFKYTLSFDDVLMIPKYSDIESRKEVDLISDLRSREFVLPVMSSPMDTVTEDAMAIALSKTGGLGIIHRYNSIEDQCALAKEVLLQSQRVACAVGVSGDFLERANSLVSGGVDILCVDVAHGHHSLMERALKSLRDKHGESITIIAGNVAMAEGYMDLSMWGADAVRVGIGGGSICSTRIQTGHGVPTLQSVMACHISRTIGTPRSSNFTPAKIIADGGIRNSGDIVKSLASGADFVMLGSMLSGTKESPGTIFQENNGERYKVYRGMASPEAQEDWRGKASSLEGISTTVPYKGSVYEVLSNIGTNIRSGLSYSGARTIKELREKCEFVIQSAAGQRESATHILSKR